MERGGKTGGADSENTGQRWKRLIVEDRPVECLVGLKRENNVLIRSVIALCVCLSRGANRVMFRAGDGLLIQRGRGCFPFRV